MSSKVLYSFLFLALGGVLSAQPRAGNPKLPSTLRFRRVAEPKENAFTILVPEGWQTAGGIVRVNPLTGGGALNAIEAKADFAVKRDAQGTAMIRFFPDTRYAAGMITISYEEGGIRYREKLVTGIEIG